MARPTKKGASEGTASTGWDLKKFGKYGTLLAPFSIGSDAGKGLYRANQPKKSGLGSSAKAAGVKPGKDRFAGTTSETIRPPRAPAKSAKMVMAGAVKAPKVVKGRGAGTGLSDADRDRAARKPGAKSDDYNRRQELGSFYLNATSGMFSKKAGGKKK